ncbi:MAG: tRNA lysidine(34) synthetase TilS [Oscillospiraceae bacterium]|nr:tRNA lysidine(34) synthetase TilS [Oscillospiraceae bacterium]
MKQVTEFADKYGMLPYGAAVICAVSGGADSVCLLHILNGIAPQRGIKLYAAHFNHCLRGEESDRDESFVRSLCRDMGIELFCASGDVNGYAKENGLGMEEAARVMRYKFFEETASKIAGSRVATAHNADDNVETVLMNLTRGAGLKGLCGIPPVRDIYIRPLLCMSRDEINAYLERNGVDHVEDSTNAESVYTRNRLRHEVIPVLKSINPGLAASVKETSELVREDESLLEMLSQQAVPFEKDEEGRVALSCEKLKAAPYPLAARGIRRAAAKLGCYPASVHVKAEMEIARGDDPSAETQFPDGINVSREYDMMIFSRAEERGSLEETALQWNRWTEIRNSDIEVWFGDAIDVTENSAEIFRLKRNDISGDLTVRARRTGDKICLNRRQGSKTLKKLFIEKKIPAERRAQIPIIADNEKIIAIPNLGRSVELSLESEADCVIVIKQNN